MMKNRFYLLTFLLCIGSVALAQDFAITLNELENTVRFEVRDHHLRTTTLDGQQFTKLVFDGEVTTKDKGFAELPFLHASVMIDPVKNVTFEVIASEYTDHQLDFPLVPSRGVIYRDQDPSQIPYAIAPESITNDFYPKSLISSTDPFIIKDVRGATVYVYPFRYISATQTLRVYNEITIRMRETETPAINPLLNAAKKKFREMEGLYQSVFLNYKNDGDDLSVGEAGDILVITTARDETVIQSYIDWKREKGYTVFHEVVATGTNVKSLIQQKYNENNNLLYVQLVGDWADIKSDLGGGANAPTDPMLGCVSGNDNYPDIAIGRFSATTTSQVTTQITKVIQYEKNPSGNWYENAVGVASNQGPGDDGEYDNEQVQIIYDNKLDPLTYNNYSYAYDPDANAIMVGGYINNGAGVINYCGHGSMTSWGSSGFSNTDVNQLNNGNMLPVIFSVACVNGAFHSGECFAEAWLKKSNGGAVMTLMSTINQPWQPPMRGQDYFNDILTGGYNYSSNPGSGINTTEGRTTIGAIVANGLTLMYTESNGTDDLETIQTWTTFGDPSMQVRTKSPDALSLSNTTLLTGSPFSTTITSSGSPVAGAMVCLSQNGVYKSGYTDASGNINLDNTFEPGDVKLVVTAFNTETIDQNIENIPPSGPYMVLNSATVNDSNNQLDCGETTSLNIALENSGVETARNVTATLSCNDPLIEIGNNAATFGNIQQGATIELQDAYEITASGLIPEGHSCNFEISITDGTETWEGSFAIVAHAPVLEMDNLLIDDNSGNNNQQLDPGETANFMVTIANNGSSDAIDVTCALSTSNLLINFANSSVNLGAIDAGNSKPASFELTAGAGIPIGTAVNFSLETHTGTGLSTTESFQIIVGQIPALIIDLDENNNSASSMIDALGELDIAYETATTIPAEPEMYSTIFLCLGIYSDNHALTSAEGTLLANYLNNGGQLYMEGGDTWYYDTQTSVHGMFGINATADGSADMGTIQGQTGTFTEGISFLYTGDNNWMDHLEASGTGELILQNASPAYGCAVANDASTYKTIGSSFEFGGLSNTESTKTELMEKYAEFFGLLGPETVYADFYALPANVKPGETVHFSSMCTGPVTSWEWDFDHDGIIDSYNENPDFVYSEAGTYDVNLTIWGTDGQTSVMLKENYISVSNPPVTFEPVWETPFNPMNIYITQATLNGIDLQAGAQIGIFDIDPNNGNELCVAAATLTSVINQTNYLEIIASMNDGSNPDEANGFTPGNAFTFKFIDNESQVIEPVNYTFPFTGYDEVFTPQGSSILKLNTSLLPPDQQIVPLYEGWNAISSYLIPQNTSIEAIMDELGQNLEFVQNTTEFYQPGNGESSLNTWNYKSGYLVKTDQPSTLTLFGFSPAIKTISLQTGWNLISVLSEEAIAITEVFGNNLDKLECIKEPAGTNLFWPEMEISGLKMLEPGKAYLVKASSGFSITY